MAIQWNKVTWYSKLLALILFVALPFTGFYLGIKYESLTSSVGVIAPHTTASSTASTVATSSSRPTTSAARWKDRVNECIKNADSFLQPITTDASASQTLTVTEASQRACITLPEEIYP